MTVKGFCITKDIVREIDGDVNGVSIYLKGSLSDYIKTNLEDKDGEICVYTNCYFSDIYLIVTHFGELSSPDWTPTKQDTEIIKEIVGAYLW